MKKILMILMAIAIMGLTGCSMDDKNALTNSKDVVAKETEESSEVKDETSESTEQRAENVKEDRNDSYKKNEIKKKAESTTQATTEIATTEATEQSTTEEATEAKNESTAKETTEACTESQTEAPTEEKTEAATEAPVEEATEAEPQESSEVSYSPGNVVSLATAKCQAGGMITTTDNLANLLAEGKITEEEYNDYYPYDGLGYYSVFVETDLNKAATTSGRLLGSEDAIATYIADMLLLESNPYFLIEYGGVTNSGGQDFYEFRCYR